MGRLLTGRESQKTCLQERYVLRGQEDMISCRIQDKNGTSWIDYSLIGPGFFISGPEKA